MIGQKEIQEKLDNLPESKYLYQRYNGKLTKYEIQDNILINVKNANDIIDINRQLILGSTSENILDLLEVGDIIVHGVISVFTTVFETEEQLFHFKNLYKNENPDIIQVVTHEQIENIKFEV